MRAKYTRVHISTIENTSTFRTRPSIETQLNASHVTIALFHTLGSGDIPLGETYYNQLQDAGRTVAHFPFLIGAMSFFHNIPGIPISGKHLSTCSVCMVTLNSGLQPP